MVRRTSGSLSVEGGSGTSSPARACSRRKGLRTQSAYTRRATAKSHVPNCASPRNPPRPCQALSKGLLGQAFRVLVVQPTCAEEGVKPARVAPGERVEGEPVPVPAADDESHLAMLGRQDPVHGAHGGSPCARPPPGCDRDRSGAAAGSGVLVTGEPAALSTSFDRWRTPFSFTPWQARACPWHAFSTRGCPASRPVAGRAIQLSRERPAGQVSLPANPMLRDGRSAGQA